MPLNISNPLLNRAKDRAIEYLEFNIASIAISLNLDLETLSSDLEIPVSEDSSDYHSYVALKGMCASLEKLQES